MKTFLSTIVGVLVSFAVVFGMELLAMTLFPSRIKFERNNIEALKTLIDHVPLAALILVIIGHGLGTYLGAYASYKIQPNSMVGYLVVMILMLIGTISNLAMIPHPMWFMVADVCVILIAGMVAWRKFHWK